MNTQVTQPKFKEGDWCFFEFKLCQVKRTTEDRISEATDGMFSTSSYDMSDRCFPLDLRIKVISGSASYWSDKFHSAKGGNLNHPDLHRELVRRWVEACEATDDDATNKILRELEDFGKQVMRRAESMKSEELQGVRLFR